MKLIEKVKKILEDNLVDGVIISAEDLEGYTPILDRMSNQICRLIPKSPDNPDGKVDNELPRDCQSCEHHHCHYDSDGIQDCSCDLSVFARTQTLGIPEGCPLKSKPDSGRLLTMVEMSRAITERRRILELNGHKPNTQDARYAVTEAQRDLTASEWEVKEKEFLEAIEDARQCGYLSGMDEGRVLKDEERKDKNSVDVSEAYFRGRQDGLMIKEFEYQARVGG